MSAEFAKVAQGKKGLEAANDPKLVAIAADSTKLQKEILSGKDPSLIVIPDAYKPRGSAEKSLQERTGTSLHTFDENGKLEADNKYLLDVKDGQGQVAVVATPDLSLTDRVLREGDAARAKQERGEMLSVVEHEQIRHAEQKREEMKQKASAETTDATAQREREAAMNSVHINTGDVEAQKIQWMKDNKEEVAKDEAEAAKNSVYVNTGDVEAQKAQWLRNHPEEAAEDEAKRAIQRAKVTNAPESSPSPAPENRVYLSSIDIDLGEMEKDAMQKVEKVEEVLEVRQEKSRSKLEALGVSIKKGFDYYRGMKPRNKILIGVALAGASVLSGGGVAGAAVASISKVLSAGSYGSGFYDKILKAEQDKGNDPNKPFLIARSAIYGTLLALGTSALFSELASQVDTNGIFNAAGEKLSSLKDGLKHLFAGAPDVIIPPVSDYVIQPGDNLTTIFKAEVLSKIPGAAAFTDAQKENVFQNLLTYAAENKTDPDFATINKFADPNMIRPGETVDVKKLTEMVGAHYAKFGGDTLIEHASSLNSSVLQANIDAGVNAGFDASRNMSIETPVRETVTPIAQAATPTAGVYTAPDTPTGGVSKTEY